MSLYAGAIVLETAQPMNDMESLTRKTLASINPNLTVVKFQTFDQQIAGQFTGDRMIARLMTLFGALALLLATLGLYGVTAYTVVRRTSEIGIPTALLCVRFVKSQLYEASGHNVPVMIAAIVVLVVSAALAGLIPARRAASTNPSQALRAE